MTSIQPDQPRDGEDPAGWTVTITGVTLTLYTDGPPHCPDEWGVERQVYDKLRAAAKCGVFFTVPAPRAKWTMERDR